MIEFQHVSKQYTSDAVALSDISLNIAKGELVFLAGRPAPANPPC